MSIGDVERRRASDVWLNVAMRNVTNMKLPNVEKIGARKNKLGFSLSDLGSLLLHPKLLCFPIFCQTFEKIRMKTLLKPEMLPLVVTFFL